MSKILIKNGTVIDGSRSARFQADVLVEGERIVKIGKIDEAADRVIATILSGSPVIGPTSGKIK